MMSRQDNYLTSELGADQSMYGDYMKFLFHSEILKVTMPQREAVHLAVFA